MDEEEAEAPKGKVSQPVNQGHEFRAVEGMHSKAGNLGAQPWAPWSPHQEQQPRLSLQVGLHSPLPGLPALLPSNSY